MAEALVSVLLEQLITITSREIEQKVKLVVGVDEEAEKLSSNLRAIKAVIEDAEKRQVNEAGVRDWLDKLKDISYDMDDLLDEWSTALLKLQIQNHLLLPQKMKICFCFDRVSHIVLRHDIAEQIKGLNQRLDQIAREKNTYGFNLVRPDSGENTWRQTTSSFVDESDVRGRNEDKEVIVRELVRKRSLEQSSPEETDIKEIKSKPLQVLSIVGMGGIGKTTLAQLAYNHYSVKNCFQKTMWLCVSASFNEENISKMVLQLLPRVPQGEHQLENVLQRMRKEIQGKKFLLVLDDVWNVDPRQWEQLKLCLEFGDSESKVLVTTRKERVASIMGSKTTQIYRINCLSETDCWSLFSRIAFHEKTREEKEELESIGWEIAQKCKGLPLAAKALGSLLRFKKTPFEWRTVLDSRIWDFEEVEKGIFHALLLSYYDLPSPVRRCFSYCAVFPKGHLVVKDELIFLWIAEGYVSSKGSIDMEVTAEDYFDILVMHSFFENFEKDRDSGSILRFKMHDIVHDVAQYLVQNECLNMEADGRELQIDLKRARHSTLILNTEDYFPVPVYKAKKLRTLLAQSSKVSISCLSELFQCLTCLRSLDLSKSSLDIIPRDIGKLIHLRYLNLSSNYKLMELPSTVCHLSNLQTLNLSHCTALCKLPSEMGKLIKLRHLILQGTYRLKVMPKGMGKLCSLRTLSKFSVSGYGDSGDNCSLGELENLNCIRGDFRIERLGSVDDMNEATKAQLKHKKHILSLDLDFTVEDYDREHNKIDDNVLDALQPHSNLEYLLINNCIRASACPSWIMELTKLKKLLIHRCINFTNLPPLGKLPSLESLEIYLLVCVEKVGVEFLGVPSSENGNDGTMMKGKGVMTPFTSFPKLKRLSFSCMDEWEEWDELTGDIGDVKIMPCLTHLELEDCPKLKATPQYLQSAPLHEVNIKDCPILENRTWTECHMSKYPTQKIQIGCNYLVNDALSMNFLYDDDKHQNPTSLSDPGPSSCNGFR